MSNKTECDDIIMEDNYGHRFSRLFPTINFIKKPRKRTYIEMLNESKQLTVNNRLDNYRIFNKKNKTIHDNTIENNINSNINEKRENIINDDIFSDFKKAKKNLIVKKKLEYDEEKEKKFVEDYYRIKNAELNKLRFGTE